MTPILPKFNTGLFAINTLFGVSSLNSISRMNAFNSFGSVFSALNHLKSFNSEISLFGMMNQSLSNFSSTSSFSAMQSLPSMPALNFNFSNLSMPAMPAMPSFNFNFGSLLTSGRTNFSNPSFAATSTKAQRAVQAALSQVGVQEIGNTNNGAEINKYRNGVQNGVAWCASFVSWCYGQGQNDNNNKTFGYTASSQDIREKAEKAGYYKKSNSGYTPKVGDVVIWNYGSGKGHAAIVSAVNSDGTFQTVEGNCSNAVRKMTRNKNEVDGFVQMNEWLEA